MVNEELKNFFRPEFINRIDEIVVFNHLDRDEIDSVADILLEDVYRRLREIYNIELELSPAFREKLISEGYDKEYGARPMRRSIVRLLEDSLADAILEGSLPSDSKAKVDLSQEGKVEIHV
jgi:ATP-dependent Clp protease ATP-binding subunit ClpC